MKKFLALMIAAAFALSVSGSAMAEEKKPVATPAAKKEVAPKAAKLRVVTGPVEAVDPAAGTISVKGRKETVSLKAAEGVKLDEVKVGEKVTVTFKGDALSKIVKGKGGKQGKAACPSCCKECKCKDCSNCPKDCKDCPNCKDCKDCPKAGKGGKDCKDCPKAAKAGKACDNCPKAEAAPGK